MVYHQKFGHSDDYSVLLSPIIDIQNDQHYQSKGHDQHHGQQLSTVEWVWQVVNLSGVLDVHDASRQLLATMGFIIKPALLGWFFSI